jgi:hypothetical protein
MGTPIEADPLSLSAGLSHRAITERILALAGRSGDKTAVIDAVDGTVTAWPRFGWTIRAAAHGLSQRGLAAGDTVGVFVQDAASFAVAVNAIRAGGATALAIRPDAGVADVAARLNAGGVRLLITSAPLAELAAEAADRSRVRQVFAFGEAAGTTPFRSLLAAAEHGAGTHGGDTPGADTGGADTGGADTGGADTGGRPEGAAGLLTSMDGRPGLCHLDVVVAGPPCGDGHAYTSLLDLTLLTGATIVAAPVPLVAAAMRVYRGTAAIVPGGTAIPGLPPDRVFTVALSGSTGELERRSSSTHQRSPTVVTGTTPAAKPETSLRLSWWIRARRSIRCIPPHPIHHQARIHHRNLPVESGKRSRTSAPSGPPPASGPAATRRLG